MHLLGKLANQICQILRGQSSLENLLVPSIGFLLAGSRHAKMRIAGFVRVAVSGTEQCLGVNVLLGKHVVDIGDLLDERLRIDAMFLVVGDLDVTAAIGLVDGLVHGVGDVVGIHDDGSGHISRGATNRLDEGTVGTQESRPTTLPANQDPHATG